MSLYIGKETDGVKVAVSNTTMVKDDLRDINTIDSRIIFNSKLPYLCIDYFTTTNFTTTVNSHSRKIVHTYTSEELAKISPDGTARFILFFVDGISIAMLTDYDYTSFVATSYGHFSYRPSTTQAILYMPSTYTPTEIRVAILPFDINGGTHNLISDTSIINIGNGDFTIGGVSLFKQMYLVQGIVNASDDVLTFFGNSYQVVNSISPTSDSITISSSATATEIRHGDKVVLSSNLTYTPLTFSTGNVASVVYPNFYYPDAYEYTVPAVFTGLTFATNGYYLITIQNSITTLQNRAYLCKADSQEHAINFYLTPDEQEFGNALFITYMKVTTTSISLRLASVNGAVPIEWWTGPQTVTVKYVRVG